MSENHHNNNNNNSPPHSRPPEKKESYLSVIDLVQQKYNYNNNNYNSNMPSSGRTKGLAEDDDHDDDDNRPRPNNNSNRHRLPSSNTIGTEEAAAIPPSLEIHRGPLSQEQVRPSTTLQSSQRTRTTPPLSASQMEVKSFMVANGPLFQTSANATNNPASRPGAVAVAGMQRRLDDDDDEDTLGGHTNDNDNDDEEVLIHAHVAPDEEHVAARVAERLERQMTEQWTERLKQEVSAQLSNHTQRSSLTPPPPPVVAQAVRFSATDQVIVEAPNEEDEQDLDIEQSSSNNSSNSNGKKRPTNNDLNKICGISRTCWGVLLFLWFIVMVAASVTGVLIWKKRQSQELETNPTSSPTLDPTHWNYWKSILISNAPPPPLLQDQQERQWKNPMAPQYKALFWMSYQDEYLLQDDVTRFSPEEIQERYALAVFYFATTPGRHTTTTTSSSSSISRASSSSSTSSQVPALPSPLQTECHFLSPVSVCEWNNGMAHAQVDARGVYCSKSVIPNEQPRVSIIKVPHLTLMGRLPQELVFLTNVLQLDMDHNTLMGSLPLLGSLTQLEAIWMQDNALTGKLSLASAAHWPTSLVSLDLEQNQLTGSLYYDYDNDNNDTQDALLPFGQRMSHLRFLGLRLNQLTGSFPDMDNFWQGLVSLETLDVEGNGLVGTIPSMLGDYLVSLRQLFLEHNALSGSIPPTLSQCTLLEQLFLNDNQFTGTLPIELASLTTLQTVWFQNNPQMSTQDVNAIFCSANMDNATIAIPSLTSLQADCGILMADDDDDNNATKEEPLITCTCCTACCPGPDASCSSSSNPSS